MRLFCLARKIGFLINSCHEKAVEIDESENPMMVCPYCFYYIDLPVVLVDFHMEHWPSRLHPVCQGEYVVLNDIDFDGADRKVCCACVDKLHVEDKSETLKKVGYITLYRMEK